MTTIKFEDVRKGDLVKVQYEGHGLKTTRTGVAYIKAAGYRDWKTVEGGYLDMDNRGAVITLLERPKTPEELLTERRDKLVQELATSMSSGYAAERFTYRNATDLSRAAVDRIIKLEDKVKESL